MRRARDVTAALRAAGELWEPGPGLVALRGHAADLMRRVDAALRGLCLTQASDEWVTPPLLHFDTLVRADYFASFPQWLTAMAHLSGPADALAGVAAADDPAAAARRALRPAPWAMQPAVCYHVYHAIAGRSLDAVHACSVVGTCCRRETWFAALERSWPFTMREAVCVGGDGDVREFREAGRDAAVRFAIRLGLEPRVEPATDPFFDASTRGRQLLQRLRGLKHELLLPIGADRSVAAASFNHHAAFFGEAFAIRDAAGAAATSGCVAFGVERWVLAVLTAHGTDFRDWPLAELEAAARMEVPCPAC